jgi:hypothetical protein
MIKKLNQKNMNYDKINNKNSTVIKLRTCNEDVLCQL